MSTGGKRSNQSNESQGGGGNVVGGAPRASLHKPPAFQGKSGQGDNQSTSRGKGRA